VGVKGQLRGPFRAGTPSVASPTPLDWVCLIIRVTYISRANVPPTMEPLQRLLKLIAASLHLTAPSALAHVTPLEELGLVGRHRGKSRLTNKGRTTLLEYRRHHRVAESLFGSLGLSPLETCAAALEIDLAMSHRTVEELCRAQQHPTVCPHGEPIPPCHDPHSGA
jgi:Mn-dependent DtxR family transcriptional regulator